MNADEQAVVNALKTYERALNASETGAVMPLYAPDGVFMPQNSPSSVGIDAIREAYDAVFSAITLKVEFKLAEVRQLAPDWVLARGIGENGRCARARARAMRRSTVVARRAVD